MAEGDRKLWVAVGGAAALAGVVWWMRPRGPGVPGLDPGGRGFAEPGPGDSDEHVDEPGRRRPAVTVDSPRGRPPTRAELEELRRRAREAQRSEGQLRSRIDDFERELRGQR